MKNDPANLTSSYKSIQNQSLLIGKIIVVLMMLSVAVGVAQFGVRLQPGWNGGYLIAVGLFVAIEAILVREKVKDIEGQQKIIFRVSEWVAFAVIVKVCIYLFNDPSQLMRDLPLWQDNFLESFFTAEYMLALLITAAVWWTSSTYTAELENLFDRELDASWDEIGKVQNVLREMRNRIASRVFIVGIVVVAFAIASRIDASIIFRERGLPPPGYYAPVANVLVYFLLALVLLSQTQFALMRTRWLFQRLPVSPQIARNWLRYGFFFFLFLAVIVFFLPTEYSLGFFETLGIALGYLVQAITFLLALIMLPITFCLSLFSFFSGNTQPSQTQSPAFAPPPAVQPDQPIAWLEFVRAMLFWGIFIGIIVFAFRYYLLQNKDLLKAISGFPLVRWMNSAWKNILAWWRSSNRQVTAFIRHNIQRLQRQQSSSSSQILRRIFNLSRLGPREKVVHYYLRLLQLGGERGLNRKPSQTPYQFETRLDAAVPEIDQDLHRLTETFMEARYSQHDLDEPDASQAQDLWEKIRAVLKNWRKSDNA